MSRSRRKNPVTGHTGARSEKWWKRRWNRVFRRRTKEALLRGEEPPADLNEISELWDGPKDGKHRFDKEEFPQYMRK